MSYIIINTRIMTQFSSFPGLLTSVGKVFMTEKPCVCHILAVYGHFSSFGCKKQLFNEHDKDPKRRIRHFPGLNGEAHTPWAPINPQ